jgi:hypothetical protein
MFQFARTTNDLPSFLVFAAAFHLHLSATALLATQMKNVSAPTTLVPQDVSVLKNVESSS